MNNRRKILFLVTESWYFLSHRLPLAKACLERGWEVVVATRVDPDFPITTPGIRVVPITLRRAGRHPVEEAAALAGLYRIFRRERPDIVHAVGLKPVLYGAVAAFFARVPHIVTALAGMGYIFMSAHWRIRLIRRLLIVWLRLILRRPNTWLILQNYDDIAMLITGGVAASARVLLVRGSGVDLAHFQAMPEPEGIPVFAVVSRMLRDKGIREVVLAARLLVRGGVAARVLLVGGPDPDNPTSLSEADLAAWHAEGCIEWLGPQRDIRAVWRDAHVCVLPSYREGLPKALLEAAACGRPIITTDVPGCRAVVDDGVEGRVVPQGDWRSLARAMAELAGSPELRRRMGTAARRRAEADFGEARIVAEVMALYDRILDGGP